MSMKTLEDAFVDELRDILSAEKQITKALPKMIRKASNADLREALENHLRETEEQINRIERAFETIGKTARAKKCEGMKGILDEGEEMISEAEEDDVLDAAMIAAAQKVEHYEIASYGTLCTWGETLGFNEAVRLLRENLSEEKAADQKLTQIAERNVNREAVTAGARA